MQSITHKYTYTLETLNQVEYLYIELSKFYVEMIQIPSIFEDLIKVFRQYGHIIPRMDIIDYIYSTKKDLPHDDRFMVVCASGGKDSTAVAQYYHNQGYRVILYHMKGINPAYYDEFKAVKQIASDLEIPFYIDEVNLNGGHCYVEHPMKNMLIANGAIQFCLDNNLPINIASGNYSESKLEDMDFEIDAGDSRDMWDIYENIIRHEIPDFKIHTPLRTIKDTYEDLLNGGYGLKLINDSISCMSPYRFRKHWKARTENKYGVTLLPNRCGCCAKCCLEYMVLVDYHIIEYNRTYYKYCFKRLWEIAEKETGEKARDFLQIWNRYFWYDVYDSHMVDILKLV